MIVQTVLLATDWAKWTAIGTLIAAGATIGLASVTVWLVVTTRRMVVRAGDEIAIERQRMDDATRPHVFPAPVGSWGDATGYRTGFADAGDWPGVLPVTNGGPGVAMNVKAQLRQTAGSALVAETVPTSLGPGESRPLLIAWPSGHAKAWPAQLVGALYYNDVPGALWETAFRIYEQDSRHLVEVQETRMLKRADGSVAE